MAPLVFLQAILALSSAPPVVEADVAIHMWLPSSPSVAGMTQVHERCTSFVLYRDDASAWVMTAKHCLPERAKQYIMLHGFQGALDHGGDFTHVTQFDAGTFQTLDGDEDLAWRAVPLDKLARTQQLTRATLLPSVGAALRVTGFPHAQGPVSIDCVHEGFKLADEYGVLRLKAQMSCLTGAEADKRGLSGGPVLNAEGSVVGVFTSDSPDALHPTEGWAVYGYDLIVEGGPYARVEGTPVARLVDGAHRLPNQLLGAADASYFHARTQQGQLIGQVVHTTEIGEVLGVASQPGAPR